MKNSLPWRCTGRQRQKKSEALSASLSTSSKDGLPSSTFSTTSSSSCGDLLAFTPTPTTSSPSRMQRVTRHLSGINRRKVAAATVATGSSLLGVFMGSSVDTAVYSSLSKVDGEWESMVESLGPESSMHAKVKKTKKNISLRHGGRELSYSKAGRKKYRKGHTLEKAKRGRRDHHRQRRRSRGYPKLKRIVRQSNFARVPASPVVKSEDKQQPPLLPIGGPVTGGAMVCR